MIVEQIWTGNAYRNFNYLIVCEETGEALAVDPLAHEQCLGVAREKGWTITQVLNTHEHLDHTGGNDAVIAATGASLLAHSNARDSISGIDRGLDAGDVVKIGRTVELLALDTPGHTMAHICLLSQTEQPALFCGDTLFNAGAGNCHNGGHPAELYHTFAQQLADLPGNTLIYPGHDYIGNNLGFTLSREPGNDRAKALMEQVDKQDPAKALVSTMAMEQEVNTFFRLQNPVIIQRLRDEFSDFPEQPSPEQVFVKLRELRNSW
ncbi:MAG: hydroxyacylglutathione hydrolase [Halieaceae bacterium]|jgi:hydroxyacylglutathione hydrolase